MSSINDSVCTYLINSFDSFLATVNTARASLSGAIITLKTSISNLQYSALDKLQEVEADVNSKLGSIVPSVENKEQLDQLVNIIDSCPYLSNSPSFSNPLKMMRSAATSLRSFSIGKVDLLTNSYPEFDVGKTITNAMNQYGPTGFDFTKSVPNLFQIVDCVDSLCDNDISDRYAALIKTLDDLYILTNGNFDRSKMYADLHLNTNQILNIEVGVSTYNDSLDNINSTIDKSLDYIKGIGSGLGF